MMAAKNVLKEYKKYDFKKIYNLGIALISIFFSFYLIFVHEIWRDEGQAWVIARDTTLLELVSVLRHEGHPVLWYLILMPFAKSGMPCICMNVISWFFTALAVLLVVYKAPWHPIFKTVVVISPAFIYWLPVISRSYSLLNFLVLLAAYLYKKRKEHPVMFGVLLFLMINTHVIIAGFVGMALLEAIYDTYCEWRDAKTLNRSQIIGISIGIIGCFIMVLQLVNSPGTGNWNVSIIPDTAFISNNLTMAGIVIFSLPNATAISVLRWLIVFVCIACTGVCLVQKKGRMLLYCILGMGFIWYITIFVICTGNKVYMLFSILLFILWQQEDDVRAIGSRFTGILVGVFFLITIITGYPNAILRDVRGSFSTGRVTADVLNQICNAEEGVVIFYDNAYMGGVTPYLDSKVKVWDITEERYCNYTVWSKERTENNGVLKYLYMLGLGQDDIDEGRYMGSYMTDFWQSYIDQTFSKDTIVYLVLNEEQNRYFSQEEKDARCIEIGGIGGECWYSKENFMIYRMVSGEKR